MSFFEAIRTCFRKYFTFSGRASRSEYWWFFLFCFLGNAVASSAEGVINGVAGGRGATILSSAFALVTFVPQLSAGWRRMHDTGRSGLYLLYPFIVMIGLGTFAAFSGVTPETAGWDSLDGLAALLLIAGIIAFIISPLLVLWWLTRPSQPGTNDYGPNPHEVTP